MVSRLILAAAVAIVVYLVCIFFGGLFLSLNVPIAAFVGSFLKTYAVVLGVLAGVVSFATGRTL